MFLYVHIVYTDTVAFFLFLIPLQGPQPKPLLRKDPRQNLLQVHLQNYFSLKDMVKNVLNYSTMNNKLQEGIFILGKLIGSVYHNQDANIYHNTRT